MLNRSAIGEFAGGFIEGHNYEHPREGVLIGAAAGALLNAAVVSPRQGGSGSQSMVIQWVVVTDAPAVCVTLAPVYVEAEESFLAERTSQVVYVRWTARRKMVYGQKAPRVVYVSAPPARRAHLIVVAVTQPRHRYEREIIAGSPSYPGW